MVNDIQKARDVLAKWRQYAEVSRDLQDAIGGLLRHADIHPNWTSDHMRVHAENIAAAIIAADDRMQQ